MVLFAITTICVIIGFPMLNNFSVRTKVVEALSVAHGFKAAVTILCQENPSVRSLDGSKVGMDSQSTEYVRTVELSGPCVSPKLTIITMNTGAPLDPTLTTRGELGHHGGSINWDCTSNALNAYLPESCRR